MSENNNLEILKELNIAFKNVSRERIEEAVDIVVKLILDVNIYANEGNFNNSLSVFANYVRLIVKNKNINPNYVLSSAIKHTRNYLGLYLIGMLIRNGANPNVYFYYPGYGNLHILAIAALRNIGPFDYYFRDMANLLRALGADINYPVISYEASEGELDLSFVEKIADTAGNQYTRSNTTVKEFLLANGKNIDEDLDMYVNSLNNQNLMHFTIASDNDILLNNSLNNYYMRQITQNQKDTVNFFFQLSIAGAVNIAKNITTKEFPLMDTMINSQVVPHFVASSSLDEDMFTIFTRKGVAVKYMTVNNIIIYYKYFKQAGVKLHENAFHMLLEAVNIGADLDLYQFDLFASVADFDELENIRNAYKVPKWKKLCSVIHKKPREEIKQMAFDLNLDYNMDEEKICNKLKQISLIDKSEYYESAIKRQEERVASDLAENDDYMGGTKPNAQPRCDPRTTVINNPYAYNDARMSFYKDPRDGKVWCFTSDTYTSLIASKTNPYNGNPLPAKFLETIKAQNNILREIGVLDVNTNIKDALKEIYERSVINNVKSDYAYNTVVKSLSIFGVSEERFNSLKTVTLEDTILNDICGVMVRHFNLMTPRHRLVTTARVVYTLSKNQDLEPNLLYQEIARAIVGYEEITPEETYNPNYEDYIDMMR